MNQDAIQPKFLINNRSDKRLFKNESIRAATHLQPIINEFCDAIIDAPAGIPYAVIYKRFNDKWQETCEMLIRSKPKFKMIFIHIDFFAFHYAPNVRNIKKFPQRFELIIF